MARKPRRPLGRRLRRNPLARALAEGKYRKRVVPRKGTYRRRERHRRRAETDEEGK